MDFLDRITGCTGSNAGAKTVSSRSPVEARVFGKKPKEPAVRQVRSSRVIAASVKAGPGVFGELADSS